jgi:hypothetical protein
VRRGRERLGYHASDISSRDMKEPDLGVREQYLEGRPDDVRVGLSPGGRARRTSLPLPPSSPSAAPIPLPPRPPLPPPPPPDPSLRVVIRSTWKALKGATPTMYALGIVAFVVFGSEIVLTALTWYFGKRDPQHFHDTMNVALGLASPYVKELNVFLAVCLAISSTILVPTVFALMLGLGLALHVSNKR